METTRTVSTCCGVCEHSCGMKVRVQDGEIAEISGLKEHPLSRGFLCPKGLSAKDITQAPDRLKKPMKMTGGGWKEISWDEALDMCVYNLSTLKKRYGAESLLVYHGQSFLKNRIAMFMMKRFLNLFGAVNVTSAGSECFISTLLAHFTTFGNLPFPDYENSRCILLWGANPCASGGIGRSYPQMTQLFRESRDRGAAMIVIDPRTTAASKFADLHLRPRPGTDGALALGFIRAILDAGLEDVSYIEKHTTGFDRVRALADAYPLERVERITGIDRERIAEAASLFARSRPACLKVGSGLEHHTNGVQTIRATNILLSITGNVDVAGGNTFFGQAPLAPAELDFGERPQRLTAAEHPMFTGMVSQAQAVAALEQLLQDKPYPVRGMIVAGGAPLTVLAGAEKAARIMDRMEFSIVIDQFMNRTAARADLVLPAATFLERDELIISPLALQRKVLEPDGPLADADIWRELALRCGFAEHFPWKTADEVIEHLLEPTGFTLAQVRQAPGGIPITQETGKALREGLYTASGKIELCSSSLESSGYDPLPDFHEPAESPVSAPETAHDYPLVLTTGGRYPCFVHSQHRTIEKLRCHAPEPLCEMHPDTARPLGIAGGDTVRVSSLRGSIELRAACTEGILPGVVHLPHGWDEVNCNVLIDDTARDPISGFPGLKSSLCRVEKV